MLTQTIAAPVGSSNLKEIIIPIIKQIKESTAELIVTDLKVLNTRIEVIAGKIIKLEIKRAPIILIPKTTVKEVQTASAEL